MSKGLITDNVLQSCCADYEQHTLFIGLFGTVFVDLFLQWRSKKCAVSYSKRLVKDEGGLMFEQAELYATSVELHNCKLKVTWFLEDLLLIELKSEFL